MAVWTILEHRWPTIVLSNSGDTEPVFDLSVDHAAALARRRRGVEPIRVVVGQMAAAPSGRAWDAPVPMLF
jgi:hypothetical protein